jgi:hypothetical protein
MADQLLIGVKVVANQDIYYNVPKDMTGTITDVRNGNEVLVQFDNGISAWCRKDQLDLL